MTNLRIHDDRRQKQLAEAALLTHDKQVELGMGDFIKQLRPLLLEQKRDVEAAIGHFKSERGIIKAVHKAIVPFDKTKWVNALIRFERPLVTASIIAGAQTGFDEANDSVTAFNLQDPKVTAGIERQTTNFASKFNASTERELRRNIRQAIDNGETVAEIQARINKVYTHATTFRADRAAQTEIGAAINWGKQVSYMQSKVVELKQWVSAHDLAVRPWHEEADRQRVPKAQAFTVMGERLMHPRDPRGKPENIINCRCTTIAVIKRL